MLLKEKILSVFNKIKDSSKLLILNQNNEYPRVIMLDVIMALLPACIFGCILFGFNALLVLGISCASAVLAEFLWNVFSKKAQTIGDLSALVTGLLFGMCLPDSIPLWIVPIGSIFAIIVVKQLAGGLGCNFTNPAVTSIILLKFCFPKLMTAYHLPFYHTASKTLDYSFGDLFFGMHSGSIGETASFLLIVGGIYLIIRKIISPIIPLTFIGSVAFLSLLFSKHFLYDIFGGTLILAAFFIATDYTTSPTTKSGKVIFGLGCGIFSFLVHIIFKGHDGVLFAILIMNILLTVYNRFSLVRYKDPIVTKVLEIYGIIKKFVLEKIIPFFKEIIDRLRKS